MTLSMIELTTPAASGGAGTATATVTSAVPYSGTIMSVYVKYNDSPPAGTTDITLATQGTVSGAPPAQTILSIANAATDGWFQPRVPMHTTAGVVVADSYDWPVIFNDYLTLTIAQADNNDSVKVWVVMDVS